MSSSYYRIDSDPRDAAIGKFLLFKDIGRAVDFVFNETIMQLDLERSHLALSEGIETSCNLVAEQVILKMLTLEKEALEDALDRNAREKGPGRVFRNPSAQRIIEFALLAATATLLHELKKAGSVDSSSYNRALVIFKQRIERRVKGSAIIWCKKKRLPVYWDDESGRASGAISGRDLVNRAITDIWNTSFKNFSPERAFEWVRYYVATCAGWSFGKYMTSEKAWSRVYLLTRDIAEVQAQTTEPLSCEDIAVNLKEKYLSAYWRPSSGGACPTLKDLRKYGVPDLSQWNKGVNRVNGHELPGGEEGFTKEEFIKLLDHVITAERIQDLIMKEEFRSAASFDEMDNPEPPPPSPYTDTLITSDDGDTLISTLEEIHGVFTRLICRKEEHQKAFLKMWSVSDEENRSGLELDNLRMVRKRAIEKLQNLLARYEAEGVITADESRAMSWLYFNRTVPYDTMEHVKRGTLDNGETPSEEPQDWKKLLQSGLTKLKKHLAGKNTGNNNSR